jgi:hypothetical protein
VHHAIHAQANSHPHLSGTVGRVVVNVSVFVSMLPDAKLPAGLALVPAHPQLLARVQDHNMMEGMVGACST